MGTVSGLLKQVNCFMLAFVFLPWTINSKKLNTNLLHGKCILCLLNDSVSDYAFLPGLLVTWDTVTNSQGLSPS